MEPSMTVTSSEDSVTEQASYSSATVKPMTVTSIKAKCKDKDGTHGLMAVCSQESSEITRCTAGESSCGEMASDTSVSTRMTRSTVKVLWSGLMGQSMKEP